MKPIQIVSTDITKLKVDAIVNAAGLWLDWLVAHIGVMTAYLISFIDSLFGVYVGIRINKNYLS